MKEEKLERQNELIVQNPSSEDVNNEIVKMKDVAPDEDEIRLRYIREGGDEIRKACIERSSRCEKTQHIDHIPLHKKGDKADMNNFRGVCLLPIMCRILERILARRLRNWAEATGALEENEADFRQESRWLMQRKSF